MTGKVNSLAMAAEYFNVKQNTLNTGLKRGFFNKRGKSSVVFTKKEENILVGYIKSLDFEVTIKEIRSVIQEALLDVTKNNPERKTGMEDTGQMPGYSWVRRFVARNNINVLKPSNQYTSSHGLSWQEVDLERFEKWQRINYGS